MTKVQVEKPLRVYQPVWQQLRAAKNHTIVLEVLDEGFVPRIKRMISKEKDMDDGFKLLNELECVKLKFVWNSDRKELTVKLVQKIGLVEIES